MRGFLIFLLVAVLGVGGMYYAGWLSFDDRPDETQINIHKDDVKQDTQEAIQKGKDLLDETTDRNSNDPQATDPSEENESPEPADADASESQSPPSKTRP